jgi:L-ascorbate metabolism protein UlaG (beta-lactamase superfamily)
LSRVLGIFLAVLAAGVARPARADDDIFKEHVPLIVRWTSVAGFILDDGETKLWFDPIFTRPGVLQWLGVKELTPDSAAIRENLRYLGVKKVDAVFVSHEHFDHAVDASVIAHRLGATLYGGPSLERIAKANEQRFGWKLHFQSVTDRQTVQVGKFRIKFFRRTHPAIFPKFGFHFLEGPVPKDFHFGFYQYDDGDVFCMLIDHPDGRIFFDQSANFFEGARADLGTHVDTMLLGIANKKSVADWVGKFIAGFHPKLVIPLHFDFFFTAPDRQHTKLLPGTEYDRLVSESAKISPRTRFRLPRFGESILIE